MEKDKASTPNKGKVINVGSDSNFEMEIDSDIEMATEASALDIEMAKDILGKLDTEVRQMPTQQNGSESHGSECCIYRVPNQLRNVNSKAYDPNLISIGPLHHGNKGLEAMEKAKLNYFRKFTEGDGVDEKKMCDIVISIKNQEERLRNCYSEKSILMESSDDFVKMILLDAVFIILFFLESNDDKGPKILQPWKTVDMREDLMLLENQLPLFIIQEIYGRVYPRSKGAKAIPFLDLATSHFIKESFLKRVETGLHIVEGSRHFTDLLRNLMFGLMLGEANGQCDFRSTHLCADLPDLPDLPHSKTHFTDLPRKLKTTFTDLLRKMMLGRAIEQSEQSETSETSEQREQREQSWKTETDSSSGVDWKTHFTDLLRKLMLGRAIEQSEQSDQQSEQSDQQSEQSDQQTDYSRYRFNQSVDEDFDRPSSGYLTNSSIDEDFDRPSSGSPSNPGANNSRLDEDFLSTWVLKYSGSPSNPGDALLSTRVLKYSAVKLLKAGVRFEASKSKYLVNITFDKGVLKIPLLEVDHCFERRIRNIMALEQCCYPSEAYICSYMKLMDHLIDSAEDVGLLVRKGIIVHRLGDDAEVSSMINNLCEHIGDNYALFGDISRRLNAHYDNSSNHRKATLKLVYFPNIWRGTATVAAAILLILTFIQAVCSVISLF